jgi:hypothetical protein
MSFIFKKIILYADPYAATTYLFSYVLKSEPGICRLLNDAVKESKEEGLNQLPTLRKVANAIQNGLMISSPQVNNLYYIILYL